MANSPIYESGRLVFTQQLGRVGKSAKVRDLQRTGLLRDLRLAEATSAMPTTRTPIGTATGVSAKKKSSAAKTIRTIPPMNRYLFMYVLLSGKI
jgi:hypothetical protein